MQLGRQPAGWHSQGQNDALQARLLLCGLLVLLSEVWPWHGLQAQCCGCFRLPEFWIMAFGNS